MKIAKTGRAWLGIGLGHRIALEYEITGGDPTGRAEHDSIRPLSHPPPGPIP